jgi:hypothetical protein
VADDVEYDERDAVVRIPKGGRLADSRKSEGWSRGYTPKSADRGPEHVEIRLKDEGDSYSVQEPEITYVTEFDAPSPRELSVAQQAIADLLTRVIDELIDAARPHVANWWNTQVVPAMRAKRDDLLLKHQARKTKRAPRVKPAATPLVADHAEKNGASLQQLAADSDDSKITLTSAQFQQLFLTWLAREDAQQALWHAIANARIMDGDATTLAWRKELNGLPARQRTERVREIFFANPSILKVLGRHLVERRPLELGEAIRRRDKA